MEPEAVVPPRKNKQGCAPSYKPSVLANDALVIVGWDLDPAQEAALVPNLLDQASTLGTIETALFEAGCHTAGVITATDAGG